MAGIAGVKLPSIRMFVTSAIVVIGVLWILRNTGVGQKIAGSLKV